MDSQHADLLNSLKQLIIAKPVCIFLLLFLFGASQWAVAGTFSKATVAAKRALDGIDAFEPYQGQFELFYADENLHMYHTPKGKRSVFDKQKKAIIQKHRSLEIFLFKSVGRDEPIVKFSDIYEKTGHRKVDEDEAKRLGELVLKHIKVDTSLVQRLTMNFYARGFKRNESSGSFRISPSYRSSPRFRADGLIPH